VERAAERGGSRCRGNCGWRVINDQEKGVCFAASNAMNISSGCVRMEDCTVNFQTFREIYIAC